MIRRNTRRCTSVCLALLGALSIATAAAARPAVTDARLGSDQNNTRFVIDVTEDIDFRVFTLADPYRVVIDLPEVDWQMPFASGQRGSATVARIRYNLFKAGTSRIVLDLNQPFAVARQFSLKGEGPSGRRLVIDLAPATHDAFMAAAGWPDVMPEAKPPATGKLQQERPPVRPVVVIDPGHGGKDPGAQGVNGVREADVVLDMAKVLRDVLEESGRYQVALTRDDNTGIALRQRSRLARIAKADLFISLHADKIAGGKSVRGMSVYTLSQTASDQEAEALAHQENMADVLLDVDMSDNSEDVNNILIDLAMRDTMNRSVRFAGLLLPELAKTTPIIKNAHRSAGFAVLKAPDVPSVLVELGYLSNPQDAKNLTSERWRKDTSKAILRAIDLYFGEGAVQEARLPPG